MVRIGVSCFFALFLILPAVPAANAQTVPAHYCKDPASLGRSAYVCAVNNACNTTVKDMVAGLPAKILPWNKGYKVCMQKCRAGCKANATKKNAPRCTIDTCQDDCNDGGTQAEVMATAQPYNDFIVTYYNECGKSLKNKNAQACEQTEAKAYCAGMKQLDTLLKKKNWVFPPESQDDLNTLQKYGRIAQNAWTKRCSDVGAEIGIHDSSLANMKTQCSKNHACALEVDKLEEGLKSPAYTTVIGNSDSFNKALDQMGCKGGCAPADCVPNRDDAASSQDGCMCDEFCETANDCCGNFRDVCGPVLGLAAAGAEALIYTPRVPRR